MPSVRLIAGLANGENDIAWLVLRVGVGFSCKMVALTFSVVNFVYFIDNQRVETE